MKIKSALNFLLILLTTSVFAQAPFEGVIKFKGENKTFSETSDVEWFCKDGNSRLNITAVSKELNTAYSLFFLQGQGTVKMTSEGNGKRMMYDLPYSAFANAEFASAFSADATGKRGNFAGFDCEEYEVKTSNSVVSCWVSKTTGISPASFPAVILGKGVFAVLQRNNVQGIPVKITSKDFAGNVIFDQEVISVTKMSLGLDLFTIPTGYEQAK